MLYDRLCEYSRREILPMHMPGHKRKPLCGGIPYGIDITEIPGFGNLHDLSGPIKDMMELASSLYGARSSFPLVGGGTCGVLAAVYAATRRGDKVLMARNCHKSVYNAAQLCSLSVAYIPPESVDEFGICGSVHPETVRRAILENPDAKLVVVTSPTYEGVVSDIRAVADVAHQYGMALIVDEAHGAHFGFSPYFPENAIRQGADIAVNSLHKTLPALTQTALLHVAGELIDEVRVREALSIFESSSPSYVLLASIDECLEALAKGSEPLFSAYVSALRDFDQDISALKKLRILCHGADSEAARPSIFAFDRGKLVISTRGTAMGGPELMAALRDTYKIELEMAYTDYALAMTSVCDSREDLARLAGALCVIDADAGVSRGAEDSARPKIPEKRLELYEAAARGGGMVSLDDARGMTALEYVWAYPPGIPLIAPGEVVDGDFIAYISELVRRGVTPKSTRGAMPWYILAQEGCAK